MQSLSLNSSGRSKIPVDIELEIVRLDTLLSERRDELNALQESLRAFKTKYTEIVGSRLAALEEINRAIREAETRVLGVEANEEAFEFVDASTSEPIKIPLRKLFWTVARLFHPDHATDAKEAARRHTVMSEASRAYREGDVESLHALLGDEDLQSYCAGAYSHDESEDSASQLIRLKEELRTVEFGIKRLMQDGLYRLKLTVDEEARKGRDALAAQAENINRQIIKARQRLEHLAN